MNDRLKFKIEYDHDARDGVEVEKRGRDEFLIKITKDIDLINDEEAIEIFENKFNYAHSEHDFRAEPVLKSKYLHGQKMELRKLQEAVLKGEDRHNFTLHTR